MSLDRDTALLLAVFAAAPVTFAWLLVRAAPYGRHNEGAGRLGIPARLAWVVMESPAVLAFAFFYVRGEGALAPAALVFFALWQAHYVDRAFLYPLRVRGAAGKTTPLWIAAMAFLYNVLNGYLNGSHLGSLASRYPASYLLDPRCLLGVALFAGGYLVNRRADEALRRLRAPGETGYRIPRGGLFERVSCPNYLGEIVEWSGWALLTWSLAGLSFAVFTAANLVPRALSHHRWYRATLPGYPEERRAILPFLL